MVTLNREHVTLRVRSFSAVVLFAELAQHGRD